MQNPSGTGIYLDNENIQLTELTPTCFGKVITKPPAAELSQFLTAEDKSGNCMGGGVLDKLYRFPLPTQGAGAARPSTRKAVLLSGHPQGIDSLSIRWKQCLPWYRVHQIPDWEEHEARWRMAMPIEVTLTSPWGCGRESSRSLLFQTKDVFRPDWQSSALQKLISACQTWL